jgi:hypothetical protein
MTDMINALLICESRNQVEWLINKPELIKNISVIMAANADAAWSLKKRKIVYDTIDNYARNKSLEEIESLLTDQISWAQKVDTFLQERIKKFKDSNFRPAEYYLYHIKNTWDTYIHRSEILDCIANSLKPTDIFFFPNEYPLSLDLDLVSHSSTFVDCLPEWSEYYHINQHALPICKKDNLWDAQYNTLNTYQNINYYSRKMSKYLKERIIKSIYKNFFRTQISRNQHQSDERIIVKYGYDINEKFCKNLENNGVFLLNFEDMIKNAYTSSREKTENHFYLQNIWNEVIKNDWFWKSYGSQQRYPLVTPLEKLFNHFWFKCIPELWKNRDDLLVIMNQMKPKAVIVPNIWGVKDIAQIMAAKHNSIPVIYFQHGALAGDLLIDTTGRRWGDFSLVYGDGEANLFRNRPQYETLNNVPIPVGSPRLDELKEYPLKNNGKFVRDQIVGNSTSPIFLYIPGIIENNSFRYSSNELKNLETFKMRENIAQIFHSFNDINFLYKSFVSMGYDPTCDMFSSLCPECKIISSVSLMDLQLIADVIIHERAPCTALLENLFTDKLIIAYSQNLSNFPENLKDQLAKRIFITGDSDEFYKKIEFVLEHGDFTPIKKTDDTFLKSYGTFLNDGRSAERATNAIIQIIRG